MENENYLFITLIQGIICYDNKQTIHYHQKYCQLMMIYNSGLSIFIKNMGEQIIGLKPISVSSILTFKSYEF